MSDNSDANSIDEKTPQLGTATRSGAEKRGDKGAYSPRRKTNNRPKARSVKPQSSMAVISSNIFLYKPDAELPDLSNYLNQTIEIKIERKYISKDNPNVVKRKIWGAENYTSNSDMVCILFHFNKFNYDDFISSKLRDGVNLYISVGKRRSLSSSQEDLQ